MVDYIILTFIVVFIVDYSGVVTSIKKAIWKLWNRTPYEEYRLKPLDCSLCMTFWVTLFYGLIYTEYKLLYILLGATISAYSAEYIGQLLITMKITINQLLHKWQKIITR